MLAQSQRGDRAWCFRNVKTSSHGSSAGWITGLCFHLFICSFNNNSWQIYSSQEVQTQVPLQGFPVFGVWGDDCCWERHGPAAVLPRRASRHKVRASNLEWDAVHRQGWAGAACRKVRRVKEGGEEREETREPRPHLSTFLSFLSSKQRQCHGNPEHRPAFCPHP